MSSSSRVFYYIHKVKQMVDIWGPPVGHEIVHVHLLAAAQLNRLVLPAEGAHVEGYEPVCVERKTESVCVRA